MDRGNRIGRIVLRVITVFQFLLAPPALYIKTAVKDDSIEPCRKAGPLPVPVRALDPDLQKGILNGVLRPGVVLKNAQGKAVHALHMAFNEQSIRSLIVAPNALHEGFVGKARKIRLLHFYCIALAHRASFDRSLKVERFKQG